MRNNLEPFTENQIAFLHRSFDAWFNVAEGGKRGGKNVLTTLIFCMLLDDHPDKIHLIAGVSIATAKLNILDCDGYGLLNFFDGRCREGKYKNRDCLYVMTRTGEKVLLVSGGGKSGDEKLIKGNTYGMAYITEVNECSQLFVQEVFDRTLASDNRKVFHDLNPKAPGHWYYTEMLNFHVERKKEDPSYGFNFGHFTIADNLSISDDKLRDRLKGYKQGSIWYIRDILGKRIAAEGAIYQVFTDAKPKYQLAEKPKNLIEVNIGVDFGGGKSGHAFVATALDRNYRHLVALKSARYVREAQRAEIDPDKLGQLFIEFCDSIISSYGRINHVYCDSAEQTLIAGLRTSARKSGLGWLPIENALKTTINDRIRATVRLMAQDRFQYIPGECKTLETAFTEAAWNADNTTDDERLDDGSSDIDTLDAFEYTFERLISALIRNE